MLDTHKITIFLAAVEESSFSAAAKKLRMSQPAVSLQIQALEQKMGIELFRRTGRNVVLTEAGHALVPLARQMMGLSNHIEETMFSLRGKLIGQLTIGCAATPAQYILPRLILLFRQQHPEVNIQLNVMDQETALEKVLAQEIHMGVLGYEPRHRIIKTREFMEDETVLLVPKGHPWASQTEVSLRDLQDGGTPLLREQGHSATDPIWRELKRFAKSPGLFENIMELGCPEAVISAVDAGLGIAILSKIAARRAAEAGRGAVLPFKEGPFKRTLYFFSNAEHPEVCVRVGFCDFIHTEEVSALIQQWTA